MYTIMHCMQVMKNCITALDAVSQWNSSVLSNMSARYATDSSVIKLIVLMYIFT